MKKDETLQRDKPVFHGVVQVLARRPCSPRQLMVRSGWNFHGKLGNTYKGESPASKVGVTGLVVEPLPHSNQNQHEHVQPPCSQTTSVTPTFDTSHASLDPHYRLTPTGGGLLTGEMRMDSILVEITAFHVSCL